jgi:hypothetical protein
MRCLVVRVDDVIGRLDTAIGIYTNRGASDLVKWFRSLKDVMVRDPNRVTVGELLTLDSLLFRQKWDKSTVARTKLRESAQKGWITFPVI